MLQIFLIPSIYFPWSIYAPIFIHTSRMWLNWQQKLVDIEALSNRVVPQSCLVLQLYINQDLENCREYLIKFKNRFTDGLVKSKERFFMPSLVKGKISWQGFFYAWMDDFAFLTSKINEEISITWTNSTNGKLYLGSTWNTRMREELSAVCQCLQ